MPFEVSSERRDGYIFVSPSGPVTREALVELGYTIGRCCQDSNLKTVIVDCNAMDGALPTGELYYATVEFIRAVGSAIKVAYIHPPASWNANDDKFSRDVASNHGGQLELFESEPEAVEWLLAS